MTDQAVLEKLQTVFDDLFTEPVVVTMTLNASELEEWDSVLHVSLVVAIEDAFKVRFRMGEVESTKNVGDLVALIRRHLASRT